MKKTVLFFAAAAAMMLAGCNEQEFATPELTEAKTINLVLEATRGEAPQTRTAIGYNDEYASLESTWSAGDVIYVYSRKSGLQIGTLTQSGAITNSKSGTTSQYPTSYTFFTGSLTLGEGDKLTDDYAFVYQGAGRTLAAAEGLLTYDMGTSNDVAGLGAWDIAYATGKIQGTAADASCAVSFSNKMAFGYFSTEGLTGDDINITNYYSGFTLDVKTGTVKGVSAKFQIPADKKFYMPLIAGSTVNMGSSKVWSEQGGKLGYGNISQSTSFTASAGGYYRLGRNAEVPFGPVKFAQGDWTCYETLKNSTFNVGTETAPKMVHFTQGNLQYIGSAKDENDQAAPYWRLAETQFSCLGNSNYKPSAADAGTKMPEDADNDLFGWGEVNPPFLCSNVNADYQPGIDKANMELPADANWATKFNNGTPLYIEQGKTYAGIAGEQYIVLSKAEWQNLFANQWYCGATVTLKGGTKVKGVVVCPSSITDEAAAKAILGDNAVKGATRTAPTALYDECALDQSTVDEKGLLFLPAAGYRNGTSVSNVGSYGNYWSTTSSGATTAYYVYFDATSFYSAASNGRCRGFSVRLASLASEN